MKTLILIVAVLGLSGCSATEKISKTAAQIGAVARADEGHAQKILDDILIITPACNTPELTAAAVEIAAEAKAIIVDQQQVQALTDVIQEQVTKTHDNTPQWLQALKLVAFLVGAAFVVYLLFFSPIGVALRAMLAAAVPALMVLIPRHVQTAAKFDAEAAVAGALTPEHDKAVTVRMEREPAYRTAFRRFKQKAEQDFARLGIRKDPGAALAPPSAPGPAIQPPSSLGRAA